jgi:hypothetical protein
VRAVDRLVGEALARAAPGDLARAVVYRELLLDTRPLDHAAGRQDDLEEPLGAAEALARRDREPLARRDQDPPGRRAGV